MFGVFINIWSLIQLSALINGGTLGNHIQREGEEERGGGRERGRGGEREMGGEGGEGWGERESFRRVERTQRGDRGQRAGGKRAEKERSRTETVSCFLTSRP